MPEVGLSLTHIFPYRDRIFDMNLEIQILACAKLYVLSWTKCNLVNATISKKKKKKNSELTGFYIIGSSVIKEIKKTAIMSGIFQKILT